MVAVAQHPAAEQNWGHAMSSIQGLFTFGLAYLVFVLSPGPGVAATVARGLGSGTRHAASYAAGFVLGDIAWFTVAAAGLATLATHFNGAFLVLKYAGCAYLLYMAWKIWVTPVVAADVAGQESTGGAWASFAGTLSLTLSNPKAIVYFLSVMPLVVDVRAVTLPAYGSMVAVMAVVCATSVLGVLFLATQARRVFRSERALRAINRGSAGLMAGTAVLIGLKS
jgi:threonine/homoserine/homoserine lactone efflux protein